MLDGTLCMLGFLIIVQRMFSPKYQWGTHSVLAECERHMLCVATNLDENRAVFTEDLSDSNLKCLLTFGLEQTPKMSES